MTGLEGEVSYDGKRVLIQAERPIETIITDIQPDSKIDDSEFTVTGRCLSSSILVIERSADASPRPTSRKSRKQPVRVNRPSSQ